MPLDDNQILSHLQDLSKQITQFQESFNASFLSLTKSIASNAVVYEQRFTTVERDLRGHIQLDEQLHKQNEERLENHSGEIETLAIQVGKDLAGLGRRIDKADESIEKVKTFSAMWKALVGLTLAGSGATAWLHLFGKW